MTNEFFKIIPIAYNNNKEKNIMDNTVLWNDTRKHSFEQNSKLLINKFDTNQNSIEEKINYSKQNSSFNTEYFKIKGQYLIISNEPIPLNKNAYMEIKIYEHPKINDIRHLGLCVGVHTLPISDDIENEDSFIMGNVYYTRPYNATSEFKTIDNKTLYGSKEYLAYKVTEQYVYKHTIYKTTVFTRKKSQFIKNKYINKEDSIDISPPIKNSIIGLYVDMKHELITILVNNKILYEFSPTLTDFKINSTNNTNGPLWITKIQPSQFHFAMYTIFPDIEIEGEFNLGKINLLDEKKIEDKSYVSLYSLYNNDDIIKTITDINIEKNNELEKKIKVYKNKEDLIDIIFRHNNCENSFIYINTDTNEISDKKIYGENSEKIYIGRNFYSEKSVDSLEPNYFRDNILILSFCTIKNDNIFIIQKSYNNDILSLSFYVTNNNNTKTLYDDILSLSFYIVDSDEKIITDELFLNINNNKLTKIKKENKSAFNFYSRSETSIFKLNTQTSDLSIIQNPIPKDKVVYFEFKSMYAYLEDEYEGIPFYIGLTDNISSSSYSSLNINTSSYFKIALFRKKSGNNILNSGFNIVYTNKKLNTITKYNGITLLRPVKFEQGEYVGVKIDLKNKYIYLYINEYPVSNIKIYNDSSLWTDYENKEFYFFFKVEENDDNDYDKKILKDNVAGYIICNFGEKGISSFINKNLFNYDSTTTSLYDYYNMIGFEFNTENILILEFKVMSNEIKDEDKKETVQSKEDIQDNTENDNVNTYTSENSILELTFLCENANIYNDNITLLNLFTEDSPGLITHSDDNLTEDNKKILPSKSLINLK